MKGYKHKNKRVYKDITKHPRWKGGRIERRGYIYVKVPGHPNADTQGYIAEHRLVMGNHIARPLLPEEAVHHIDGDRMNNELSNLQLFPTHGEHTRIGHPEVAQKVARVNKGNRYSPQTMFRKGHTPWNKGMTGLTPWNKGTAKTELRNCEYCGKEFTARTSPSRQGRGRYCSNSCVNKKRIIAS